MFILVISHFKKKRMIYEYDSMNKTERQNMPKKPPLLSQLTCRESQVYDL